MRVKYSGGGGGGLGLTVHWLLPQSHILVTWQQHTSFCVLAAVARCYAMAAVVLRPQIGTMIWEPEPMVALWQKHHGVVP